MLALSVIDGGQNLSLPLAQLLGKLVGQLVEQELAAG